MAGEGSAFPDWAVSYASPHEPSDPRATYLDALRTALKQAGLIRAGRLGVEGRALPHGATNLIAESFPGVQVVEIDEAMDAALSAMAQFATLPDLAEGVASYSERRLPQFEPVASDFTLWSSVDGG